MALLAATLAFSSALISVLLKKADSSLFWFLVADLAKKASFTELTFAPETLSLVLVGITYAALTLFNGTPLTLYGPVTRSNPLSSVFKTTTLFPLNLPLNKIT